MLLDCHFTTLFRLHRPTSLNFCVLMYHTYFLNCHISFLVRCFSFRLFFLMFQFNFSTLILFSFCLPTSVIEFLFLFINLRTLLTYLKTIFILLSISIFMIAIAYYFILGSSLFSIVNFSHINFSMPHHLIFEHDPID